MNERILELARQAGITFKPMMIDGEEYSYQYVNLNDYTKGVEDEAGCILMFAKLIVQECADIANKQFTAATGLDDRDCWTAVEIKKHFGVEE